MLQCIRCYAMQRFDVGKNEFGLTAADKTACWLKAVWPLLYLVQLEYPNGVDRDLLRGSHVLCLFFIVCK